MNYEIITCINCKNKLKVGIDINKYKCVYCGTEYECIELEEEKKIECKN